MLINMRISEQLEGSKKELCSTTHQRLALVDSISDGGEIPSSQLQDPQTRFNKPLDAAPNRPVVSHRSG